jgi:hypothetical protein
LGGDEAARHDRAGGKTPEHVMSGPRDDYPEMLTRATLIAELQEGAILQATFSHSGVIWSLSNGKPVPSKIASAVIALPEIVGGGDSLFEDTGPQTYRHIPQMQRRM